VTEYTKLITSEHQKPDFIGVIQILTAGANDNQALLASLPSLFDVDLAAGVQLDAVGLWAGASRTVETPLEGVYFSLDEYPGFDQGIWFDPPNTPTEGAVTLDDAQFRLLIYARIARNRWDGTTEHAVQIMNGFFKNYGITILIQDNQDMSMYVGALGIFPDAVTQALFLQGYLGIRPEGVGASYIVPSIPTEPFFGFDSENNLISGFDVGAWATFQPVPPLLSFGFDEDVPGVGGFDIGVWT
jgi:hypothetical protein